KVVRRAAQQHQALDILRIEQDIMPYRTLIACDYFVSVDRPDSRHDLFIFDALASRRMHLVKLDRRSALGRGIKLDRDGHEREADLPAPDWSCCHRNASLNEAIQSLRRRLVPCGGL